MTIQPKDVLFPASQLKLMPPKRKTEEELAEDTLLDDIAKLCLKAQNSRRLRDALIVLLGRILHESELEKTSRTHPGMIGTLAPDCEFARIE